MSKKVIDFSDIQKIILGKPKESKKHTDTDPEYISEVWYLDGDRLSQPIIRTPKLRVKYGAKKWEHAWSYCPGLYNYDIDPEISKFYNGIKDFDRHIITYWTSNKKSWNLKGGQAIKAKYFTALRRKLEDDPYFVIKLIGNGEEVLTAIDSPEKRGLLPSDITYGKYVDQYISPSYILFNSTGIHPVWQAHQIVVTPIEKIFLGDCLLDVVHPPPVAQTIPVPPMMPHMMMPMPPMPPMPMPLMPPTSAMAPRHPLLGAIRKEDLLSAIGKLRNTIPSETPKGERNIITAEDLQKQYSAIKSKIKKHIMLESIKGLPIEGVPEP